MEKKMQATKRRIATEDIRRKELKKVVKFSPATGSYDEEIFEDLMAEKKLTVGSKNIWAIWKCQNKERRLCVSKIAGKKSFSYYIADIVNYGDYNDLKYFRRITGSNKFTNDSSETYDLRIQ